MRRAPLCLALAVALLAAPAAAQLREYVRDEIRINMRAGPGLQFKILEVLTSGDSVRRLNESEDWVQIRLPDGRDGWVPSGYLTREIPPSITMPRLERELAQAQARIGELESTLGGQTEAIAELEDLRAQNELLSNENSELTFSTGWKDMSAGAGIILVGMVIGLLAPRGRGGSRKIKL